MYDSYQSYVCDLLFLALREQGKYIKSVDEVE